jgi:hypothetical protein
MWSAYGHPVGSRSRQSGHVRGAVRRTPWVTGSMLAAAYVVMGLQWGWHEPSELGAGRD